MISCLECTNLPVKIALRLPLITRLGNRTEGAGARAHINLDRHSHVHRPKAKTAIHSSQRYSISLHSGDQRWRFDRRVNHQDKTWLIAHGQKIAIHYLANEHIAHVSNSDYVIALKRAILLPLKFLPGVRGVRQCSCSRVAGLP